MLYVLLCGPSDPGRALLALTATMGSFDAGHLPRIVLMQDATKLVHPDIAQHLRFEGQPPLSDLLQQAVDRNIPIYVSTSCGKSRGLTDSDLARYRARWMDQRYFAELIASADRTVTL